MKKLERVRYCILGAGPTGLTFARQLRKNGIDAFIVLEAEDVAGGLCRSREVDGAPLDIGGGHFLDTKRKAVLDFIFELMPESEWNLFQRMATIRLRGKEVDHPLEAHLWQLKIDDQVDFLASIARAGNLNDKREPERFDEWIRWKLGDRIADEYMIPYNEKIWSIPINEIGTYWLYKLPSVSFEQTLRACLEQKRTGSLPAHGQFYYPKRYGYGEVWRRMGTELGERLRLNTPVKHIDVKERIVNKAIKADTIVNTIPWTTWMEIDALPKDIKRNVEELVYVSIDVDYVPDNLDSPAHWIYEPSSQVPYHRFLLRHNFIDGSHGHWTESNHKRSGPEVHFRQRNQYAYPVNTVNKNEMLKVILNWAKENHILPLGRWGLWEHMNSDVAVEFAIKAAQHTTRKN